LAEQKEQISEKNEELNQLVEEVTTQKDIVEEINNEISQSIDYATRLQESILPETNLLEEYLSDYFVLFKPKDKVSGDFYWWTHIEGHTVITAADCTGHGVPGAFMSMLGVSFLREIVMKEYITHPGVILRKLRKEIIKALRQKRETGGQKDGMDMAIVSINNETNLLQFSGANNPLYIITNNARKLTGFETLQGFDGFYEIKPDKMPIAIYEKMDNFTTPEIQLEKGDQLYMFSDGFADQFGGPMGKKFKYKPFKQMLLDNANKTMSDQKNMLNTVFEEWKSGLEQIDDVVILGIKI
jgi:serine phosphatase RsbU (regulator of sigma subunit)